MKAVKINLKIKIIGAILMLAVQAFAQKEKEVVKGWHLLDSKENGYHGISLTQAMKLLKTKTPVPVVVAVMDGGIDTNHYALKTRLWKNEKEIAGNGKDDDKNGYVDDVHGWNFLGNANGENVNKESQEVVRIYHQLKTKFLNQHFDSTTANKKDLYEYDLWKRTNKILEAKQQECTGLMMVEATLNTAHFFDSLICNELHITEYTADELESFIPQTQRCKKAKLGYLHFIDLLELDRDKTNRQLFNELEGIVSQQKELQSAKIKPVKNFRSLIVGDNEDDFTTIHYGNNNITGGTSPLHGTHVSGIIAGLPDSAGYVRGICNTARIMTIRCIPDGDEYDKDIALGILYAVNNGAKVINMSFGKSLSPHKLWVDDAIQYAAMHDVLIVHASGNESKNIDQNPDYPTPLLLNNEWAKNVITVGASSDSSISESVVTDFTNYGVATVDVLAPGVKIYSCLPNNEYGNEQGTSMSAPIVSGIAALIRSYFPELSAIEVKYAIEQSVDTSMANQYFKNPSGEKKPKIKMKEICKTGGVVNAYNAVKMAEKIMNLKYLKSQIRKLKIHTSKPGSAKTIEN